MPLRHVLPILLTASFAAAEPTLVGYARLDAETFRDGPTSGQFIDADNTPFVDKQPVQGISSLVPIPDEPGTPTSYYALSDNGFGSKANSADYLLCVYKVTPDFETTEVAWELAFHLSDPDDVIDWPTVADGETYPDSDIPVPAIIRENRLLTGADFDVESMVLLPDGTFWIGDEFGPFLLHFDGEGRLLEPPVGLPGEGMHSPDHPTKDPTTAKIGRSSGIEAMVVLIDEVEDVYLMPILEKPLAGDSAFPVLAYGSIEKWWDPGAARLPNRRGAVAVGEAVLLNPEGAWPEEQPVLVIQRDGEQGDEAEVKVLTSNRYEGDEDRLLFDEEASVNLLDLADPDDLDGDGNNRFRFPYVTIESVAVVGGGDERTVIVCNDNNYPFSDGRPERPGPDATEFILIRFDRPLGELATP
jgi:hypothetical protein